jgi:pimeloyl-ACP methyl ester carboxylesterase
MKETIFFTIVFFAFSFFCGCSGAQVRANTLAKQLVSTPTFTLYSEQRITSLTAPVKIYIEGDGRAFTRFGRPSKNPTPKHQLLADIARHDPAPNVAYLARPCQYVQDAKREQKYWTTARFAPEVIDAVYFAIRDIAGERDIILIAYSGGALIAGLTAVMHPDLHVKQIVTIAPNLDHKAWTEYHRLPPLTGSLNLRDYRDEFMQIPQLHYVGAEDKVIPISIVEDFTDSEYLVIVPSATHSKGFESIYSNIWLWGR